MWFQLVKSPRGGNEEKLSHLKREGDKKKILCGSNGNINLDLTVMVRVLLNVTKGNLQRG